MGTNFTDIATIEPLIAPVLNDRFDELDAAIEAVVRSTVDITVTAGENLAARDVVYIETGAGGTAGRAYKADADAVATSSEAMTIGLVVAAISSGATGKVRVLGIMDGFTGLTAGAPQFVSATAGELTESEPGNSWLVGLAVSTTEVMVNTRGLQDLVITKAVYGYFMGGETSNNNPVVTTDRIIFSSGATAANTVSDLSSARSRMGGNGISDGVAYGYVAGGATVGSGGFPATAAAERITFSSGATAANTVSDLSGVRGRMGAVSDGANYGYFAGGFSGLTEMATADRITFTSGATAANTVSDLSQARRGLGSLSDQGVYGYLVGGFYIQDFVQVSVVTADRITFTSGATAANTTSDLSQARQWLAGVSDKANYGYFAGGNSGAGVATADRLTFSSGATAANTVSDLSGARYLIAAASDGRDYGYFAGGVTTGTVMVATADRIDFSDGVTAANTTSNLSSARGDATGLSDYAV